MERIVALKVQGGFHALHGHAGRRLLALGFGASRSAVDKRIEYWPVGRLASKALTAGATGGGRDLVLFRRALRASGSGPRVRRLIVLGLAACWNSRRANTA